MCTHQESKGVNGVQNRSLDAADCQRIQFTAKVFLERFAKIRLSVAAFANRVIDDRNSAHRSAVDGVELLHQPFQGLA